MTPGQMILAAHKQQQLTGNKDAAVSFIIPGKWPDSGRKKLCGKKGPLGQCICEYEDAVLAVFKADEVITFCSKALPVIELAPCAVCGRIMQLHTAEDLDKCAEKA